MNPMTPDQVQNRRRLWLVALILVVVAAVVGATVAVVVVVKLGDSSSAAAVTLEPAASIGADPFTGSVASGPDAIIPVAVRAATATLHPDPTTGTIVAVGTTPGLYGGSGDAQVCDPQKLVAFLAQHQDKAKAWAGVFGISTNQISAYVATLTPVLLTSDTLVTNHGFRNGAATSLQSVLQAGTAVLVDRTGTPRVKCNCGNPLAPPAATALSGAELLGSSWPGYAVTNVTIVRAGPTTTSFTLVNIRTGNTYQHTVGDSSSGSGSLRDGTYTVAWTDNGCLFGGTSGNQAQMTLRNGSVTIIDPKLGTFGGTVKALSPTWLVTTTQGAQRFQLQIFDADSTTFSGDATTFDIASARDAECDVRFTAQRSSTTGPGGTSCTREALQDVFSHDPEDDMDTAILDSKDQLHCADGWAVIHFGNQGRYPLAVFRVSNGAWQVQPSPSDVADLGEGESESGGIYCTDPSFPAALRRIVCKTAP